jgi:hypothetical protein
MSCCKCQNFSLFARGGNRHFGKFVVLYNVIIKLLCMIIRQKESNDVVFCKCFLFDSRGVVGLFVHLLQTQTYCYETNRITEIKLRRDSRYFTLFV